MISELLQIWQAYRKDITLIVIASVATLLFSKALPALLAYLKRLSLFLLAVLTGQRKEYTFERQYLDWLINEHRYTATVPSQVLNPDRMPQQPRLEEIYIQLQLAHTSTHDKSVELSMRQLVKAGSRTVILGDPGFGKTTLLRYLCLTYARLAKSPAIFYRQRRSLKSRIAAHRRVIPVLIYLNRLAGSDNNVLVEAENALPEALRAIYPKGYFQRLLARGKCIVLLDGLDEISSSSARIEVARTVSSLANASHSEITWIITSRIVGYKGQLHSSFVAAIVQSLTPPQVERFVATWYQAKCKNSGFPVDELRYQEELHSRRAKQLISTLKSNPGLASLATNPMLVSLISLLHSVQIELPENRALLYRDCLGLLADRWDVFRGINTGDQIQVATHQKINILMAVAWFMHTQRIREIRRSEVQRLISEHLARIVQDSEGLSDDLVLGNLEERSGLLITRGTTESGEKIMAFSHLSFQEYLTSAALLGETKSQVYRILSNDFSDSWWREPLLLYVAQIDTPLDLIRQILTASHNEKAFENLILAASCLAEVQVDKQSDLYQTVANEIVLLYSAGRVKRLFKGTLLKFDKHNALLRHMTKYLQNVSRAQAAGFEILLQEARGRGQSLEVVEAFLSLCASLPEVSDADLTLIDSVCQRRGLSGKQVLSLVSKHRGAARFDTEWPQFRGIGLESFDNSGVDDDWVNLIPKLPAIARQSRQAAGTSDLEASSTWRQKTIKQMIMKHQLLQESRPPSYLRATLPSVETFLKLLERREYSRAAHAYGDLSGRISSGDVSTTAVAALYFNTEHALTRAFCVMLVCRLNDLDSETTRILTDFVLKEFESGEAVGRGRSYYIDAPLDISTIEVMTKSLCRRALSKLGDHPSMNPAYVRALLYCHARAAPEIVDVAFEQINSLPALDSGSIKLCLEALDSREVPIVWTAALILAAAEDVEGSVVKRLLLCLSDKEHMYKGASVSDITAQSLIRMMSNQVNGQRR